MSQVGDAKVLMREVRAKTTCIPPPNGRMTKPSRASALAFV